MQYTMWYTNGAKWLKGLLDPRSKDIFTKKGEIVELQEARANNFFVVQNIKKNQVCVRHTK